MTVSQTVTNSHVLPIPNSNACISSANELKLVSPQSHTERSPARESTSSRSLLSMTFDEAIEDHERIIHPLALVSQKGDDPKLYVQILNFRNFSVNTFGNEKN